MTGLFLAAALFLAPPAVASSTTSPHPHQGVAPKFTVPARTTSFSDKEAEQLLAGQSVRKQVKYENGGRGISIMDVKGTPAQVWAVIDDFGDRRLPCDFVLNGNLWADDVDRARRWAWRQAFGEGATTARRRAQAATAGPWAPA